MIQNYWWKYPRLVGAAFSDGFAMLFQFSLRCQNGARSSKEVLVVYYILRKQVKRKLRNISVDWIDYSKVFDTVPYSWLIKVLRVHGIARLPSIERRSTEPKKS